MFYRSFTVTGFSVTMRSARDGGKMVYRVKRLGKRECFWTDSKDQITVLADRLKNDVL